MPIQTQVNRPVPALSHHWVTTIIANIFIPWLGFQASRRVNHHFILFHNTSNSLRKFRMTTQILHGPCPNVFTVNKYMQTMLNTIDLTWSTCFNFHCFYSNGVKALSVSLCFFGIREAFLKLTITTWILQIDFAPRPNELWADKASNSLHIFRLVFTSDWCMHRNDARVKQ